MPKDEDARGRNTTTTAADPARGVHQDPHRVTMPWVLHAPGWPTNPASAHAGTFSDRCTHLSNGPVHWRAFYFKELRLSSGAALLILQGMLIKDIFPPDATLVEAGDPLVIHTGPFFFLRGVFDPLRTPVSLHDVVLASIIETVGEPAEQELLGALVGEVLEAG